MKRIFAAMTAALMIMALGSSTAFASPAKTSVIYSSLVSSPLHGNLPSVGFEATSTSEFGNAVTFSSSQNRSLSSVVVTMSSWGCVSGHWNTADCVTPSGATFSVPITFNIYAASATSTTPGVLPGALIASATQTFAIPYRPSASTKCTGADLGKWYDTALKTCFNGDAVNIAFSSFTYASGVAAPLPDSIVFGIAFNTTDYGSTPVGTNTTCPSGGCGYDSLNVALSQDPTDLLSGTNTDPGQVFWNTSYAPNYCDAGTAGSGFFRLDSPNTTSCWGVNSPYNASPFYMPSVQFKASR